MNPLIPDRQPFSQIGQALALLAIALVPVSCMVGPDYKKPDQKTPAIWRSGKKNVAASAPVSPDWWKNFNDPFLAEVIQKAITHNRDVAKARSRVRETRALRQVAAADLFPNLGGSAGALKETISQNGRIPAGRIPGISRRRDVYEGGFDVGWEIDLFGGTRRQLEAADARVQQSAEEENAVVLSVVAETARNYLEICGAQKQLAITEENINLQKKTLSLTREKQRIGSGSELDTARAEGQLLSTEALLPNLKAEIAAGAYRLSLLTGQLPGVIDTHLLKRKPLPGPPDLVPVGLPSDLLRRRPDVRRAERALAAATADIGVAVADLFPKFSLTGAFGVESLRFGDLFESGSIVSRLGPQIQWPVLQAGRIRSRIRAAKARADGAAADYEQTVLAAFSETETALERYGRELETRAKLKAATAANRRAVNLSRQRFEKGTGTLFEVIDSESRLLSTESRLVTSETAALTRLVTLFKSLGGGWETSPPPTEKPETVGPNESHPRRH